MDVLLHILLGEVAVDGVEVNPPLMAPVDSLLEEFPFAHRPKDELMPVVDQHAKGFRGKWDLPSYCRVFMLDDGTVEIYCDGHLLTESSSWLLYRLFE